MGLIFDYNLDGNEDIFVTNGYIGSFGDEDFDYRDEYNEMFGWRSLRYNQIRGDAAIRDYGGQIVETLEFRPDMSTSIE